MKDDYRIPITKEQIAGIRNEIKIGQRIDIARSDAEVLRNEKRYHAKVVEKYRHFCVCEYRMHGNKIRESVLYVQIIQGDGVWLV
ncbi:MAG: hypothetical protein PHY47_20620 [Lachnospiraceae bacterium]|nr:hypothetical protein [Lachnospiraceae bacterium]